VVAAKPGDALQVRGCVARRALLLCLHSDIHCSIVVPSLFHRFHCCMFRPHRQFPQLSGREDLILKLVTEKYQEIVDHHQHRVVDGRAETHLQVLQQDGAG
jgi:hypothetical protein